jgi:flagellar biosynthesis/type III secretory pathway protein FliH
MFTKEKSVSDGFSRWCRACKKEHKTNWYAKNAESERQKAMQYHYDNYEKNKQKITERTIKWQRENKEKYAEKSKRCYERTKHKKFAWQAFARAAKRNAIPKWINEELKNEIQKFYVEARLKTRETGTKYEVDHIVPLMGETVCGLHVPWNLRVITQFENRSKRNSFEE